ncbi:MAG: hypothetical protein ABII80_02815 [bacterium]
MTFNLQERLNIAQQILSKEELLKQEEENNLRVLHAQSTVAQSLIESKQEIAVREKLAVANGYFIQYLKPVFDQVANKLNISLHQNPYQKKGIFSSGKIEDDLQRPGFDIKEDKIIYNQIGAVRVEGTLYWDIRKNIKAKYSQGTYRYLMLGVTDKGELNLNWDGHRNLFNHPGYDLFDTASLDKFYTGVGLVIQQNGIEGKWDHTPQYSSEGF